MNWDCSKRALVLEWRDTPEASDEEMSVCFDFFHKTGRRLGFQKNVLNFLSRCMRGCPTDRVATILDLSCGKGDLAGAISDWAGSHKKEIQILACDRFGRIIQMARESNGHRKDIVFDVRDFSDPSFRQAQQFDFVVSAFSLHHLSDSQIVPYLRTVNLLAKCGFIIGDLERNSRALAMMFLLSRFWREEIIRHDARMAVRRALTLGEIKKNLREAGIDNARVEDNFGIYYSITAERRLLLQPKLSPVPGFS